MAWWDSLLEQGYTLPGTQAKTIPAEGGEPAYMPNDRLGMIAKNIEAFQKQHQDQMKKQQEEFKNQLDMYSTLREAGYDSKAAYDIIKKGKLTELPAGKTFGERKSEAEIAKTEAATKYIEAKTEKEINKPPEAADTYKGVAQWESEDARNTLSTAWMQSLQGTFPESKFDRFSPAWSKNEIIRELLKGKSKYKTAEGKIDAKKILAVLGLTVEDLYAWAMKNNPALAAKAWPGRAMMK